MPGNGEPRRASMSSAMAMAESEEPSAVPPYWSFSRTSAQHPSGASGSSILPFGLDATASSTSILRSGETSRDRISQNMPGSWTHGAPEDEEDPMDTILDLSDPAKPPVSGANATPLSPRSRYRRGLQLEEEAQPTQIACTGCTCTRPGCTCKSSLLSTSPTAATDPLDYIRPCSWLRPGAVFTGFQSFTSYMSASPPLSHGSSPYRASTLAADRRPSPYPPAANPHIQAALSRHFPSWADLSGSAVDPAMTAFLGVNGSFGYSSGSSVNRSQNKGHSAKEEWEVQVCICAVDWQNGRVEGVMKALNVPSSSPAWEEPKASSQSVTTSFTGEIVDLHNYSIWTRPAPLTSAVSSQPAPADTVWLSPYQGVDKTTDLEYWSKTEAFVSYGPGAEKEICRIAREGSWHKDGSRRRDVGDWVLMRWKERDFIDCDAMTSGLTISGYYYCCLNRKTGALSG